MISIGSNNILVGDLSGKYLTTGYGNVLLGKQAASTPAATSIFSTVAIGSYAGASLQDGNGVNTGGFEETLVGEQAGSSITTGPRNTAIGSCAGSLTTTGGSNTFIGRAAGYPNTTGAYNTYVGHATGFGHTTGDSNTFIGNTAGFPTISGNPVRTGSHNVAVGEFSGPTIANGFNTVCAGDNANTGISNTGKVGYGLTDFTISGRVFETMSRNAEGSSTGATYTVAQFLGGVILRSGPTAAFSDTTPTAAQIVAAIPGCEVGTGFQVLIRNVSNWTLTMLAGAGVTLSLDTTVPSNKVGVYHCKATNVGAGTEAVLISCVMHADA